MAGIIQYSWGGAGDTWDKPGAPGVFYRDAARTPRWMPINYSMSSTIMSKGVQNRADFSIVHAGIESEAIKAYRQTFQS